IHSNLVIVPLMVTTLPWSNSAAKEWCAEHIGTTAQRATTNRIRGFILRFSFSADRNYFFGNAGLVVTRCLMSRLFSLHSYSMSSGRAGFSLSGLKTRFRVHGALY